MQLRTLFLNLLFILKSTLVLGNGLHIVSPTGNQTLKKIQAYYHGPNSNSLASKIDLQELNILRERTAQVVCFDKNFKSSYGSGVFLKNDRVLTSLNVLDSKVNCIFLRMIFDKKTKENWKKKKKTSRS